MRRKEKTINKEPGSTRCVMLVNPNCGFAGQHARNCSASIKIEAGRFRTCEEPGATRHVRIMSSDKRGDRIMLCMNVCVECAERLGDSEKGDGIVGDVVYVSQFLQSAKATEPPTAAPAPKSEPEPEPPGPTATPRPVSSSRSEAAKRAWETIRRNRAAKLATASAAA